MTASHPLTLRRLLLAATILSSPLIALAPGPAAAQVAVGISVQLAPPVLPVYEQPAMPDVGYIWTPGYWSWSQPVGYYWVPGTWILPPQVNMLWTPPWWGWSNGAYVFHEGYWGPHVGYYGGVNYGYGYGGEGYQGGRWQGGGFVYNRTANNFGSVHIANAYASNVTVINNSHVSFNGGTGGLTTAPGAADRQAAQDRHTPMTAVQTSHVAAASKAPDLAASRNNGHPAIAATSHPAQFEGQGVVRSDQAGGPAQHTAPVQGQLPALVPTQHEATRPDVQSPAQRAAVPPPERMAPSPVQREAQPPAQRAAVPPPERMATPPAQREAQPPAQRAAVPPPERMAPPQREAQPPAQRAAAPPPERMAAPPPQREAQPPAQRAAAPPPERMAAPPPQREAQPPAQRAAAPPPERMAPPPAQHEAPRPAEKEKDK